MKSLQVRLLKKLNHFLRKVLKRTHKIQFQLEWNAHEVAEWFDHNLDLFYLWPENGEPHMVERGIFNLLAIKKNAKVLELCCADGFNTKYFYAHRAQSILSVDYDQNALTAARTFHAAEQAQFVFCDLTKNFPEGQFDNIIWDAAISHFHKKDVHFVLSHASKALGDQGILSGFTVAANDTGVMQLTHHKFEFQSKQELAEMLSGYFKNVKIFETRYSGRKNFYFFASQGTLPFDPQWNEMVVLQK